MDTNKVGALADTADPKPVEAATARMDWRWLAPVIAATTYWIAFSTSWGAAAILLSLLAICPLARLRTPRQAFYAGLLTGMAMFVPHLWFFRWVFGFRAPLLWVIAGFPIGLFVLLLHFAHRRLGTRWARWMIPVLWTGVEFFRSELYYLRFAWLLPGQVVAFAPGVWLARLGVYGLGFLFAIPAAMVLSASRPVRYAGAITLLGMAVLMYLPHSSAATVASLHVAGVQLEHAADNAVVAALDRLAIEHPEAQILVLSEYTFFGPVPESIRAVLRKHHRYLIVGGQQTVDDVDYDTAFVVGPDGEDIFEQGKSVPVQFMNDGAPAKTRRVWESPWGKIGIAVCYDLSYANVIDDFVRQGAQGLIIPTMDVRRWGEYERRMLHGRVAPIRSAEYGIPTFGVWSSGVSQLTDRNGHVIATAGYPGQGDMIAGPFDLHQQGHVPPDRYLAWTATAGTFIFILYLISNRLINGRETYR